MARTTPCANVGYVRVSSRAQTLLTQRDALERAARRRGLRITGWYADVESSTRTRPELARLLADCRGGKISKVFVYRLDRFSRNGIRDTLKIVEEIRSTGAEIETIADGFRLGPGSEIVIAVIAWAAQMERDAIGERIISARKRVESTGGHWGRPRRVDDDLVARIRARRETSTIREISIALKVPRSTVSDVLSEKGIYATNKKTTKKTVSKKRVARSPK